MNDFVSAGLTASDEVACEKNPTDLKEVPQGALKSLKSFIIFQNKTIEVVKFKLCFLFRWGFRRRDRSGQQDSGRPPSVESTHEGGPFTRGSFRFSSSKSRKSSACGPDSQTISDIFRRKASTKSTNEALHSPSSGTPSSDAFFGGSGNTTPSVTSPPPHGHYSGFSSPMTFSPPMSPPPLQPAPPPSVRLKQPHGNVFAPASEANAVTSSLSHQVITFSYFKKLERH